MKSKHLSELTAEDLNRFLVWKAGVEEDWDFENTDPGGQFLPYALRGELDPDAEEDECIVGCRFLLADGTTMHGLMEPQREGMEQYSAAIMADPRILSERGHVSFWFGAITSPFFGGTPEEKDPQTLIRQACEKLQREPAQIFPLRYESTAEIAGGPIMGVIEGFKWE